MCKCALISNEMKKCCQYSSSELVSSEWVLPVLHCFELVGIGGQRWAFVGIGLHRWAIVGIGGHWWALVCIGEHWWA